MGLRFFSDIVRTVIMDVRSVEGKIFTVFLYICFDRVLFHINQGEQVRESRNVLNVKPRFVNAYRFLP